MHEIGLVKLLPKSHVQLRFPALWNFAVAFSLNAVHSLRDLDDLPRGRIIPILNRKAKRARSLGGILGLAAFVFQTNFRTSV